MVFSKKYALAIGALATAMCGAAFASGAALAACLTYYQGVASFFTGEPVSDTRYRLSRKQAFVALANLSDAFSRLLAEPRHKQKDARQIHQFVVLTNSLVAHIAGLAHYSKNPAAMPNAGFEPMIAHTSRSLELAANSFAGERTATVDKLEEEEAFARRGIGSLG